MTQSPIDERLLEIKAQRERARQRLRVNIGAFAVVSVVLIVIWVVSGLGLPWPLLIILPWLAGVVWHYRSVDALTKEDISDEELRERIEREMERQREGIYAEVRRDTYGYEQEEVPRIRFTEEGDETDSFIRDVNEFRKERDQRDKKK